MGADAWLCSDDGSGLPGRLDAVRQVERVGLQNAAALRYQHWYVRTLPAAFEPAHRHRPCRPRRDTAKRRRAFVFVARRTIVPPAQRRPSPNTAPAPPFDFGRALEVERRAVGHACSVQRERVGRDARRRRSTREHAAAAERVEATRARAAPRCRCRTGRPCPNRRRSSSAKDRRRAARHFPGDRHRGRRSALPQAERDVARLRRHVRVEAEVVRRAASGSRSRSGSAPPSRRPR